MARSMLSFGMLCALALSTASRRRGLDAISAPPMRAAIVISRISLVKSLPRFLSWAPLRCWIFAHLLCPAMSIASPKRHPAIPGPETARMITVIAAAGTLLKRVEMSSSDPEILTHGADQDSIAEAVRQYLDARPDEPRLQAAIDEGQAIAAIVGTLELPLKLLAASTVYPLVRDELSDINTLENNKFERYFSICSRTGAARPVLPARELAAR